ncbi:hypothetical protein D3C81_2112460 [compost metagenome]
MEVIRPADFDALVCQHVQPQERGQAADRCEFGPEVAADHIGVDHGIAYQAFGIAGIDGERRDQYRRHIVHER